MGFSPLLLLTPEDHAHARDPRLCLLQLRDVDRLHGEESVQPGALLLFLLLNKVGQAFSPTSFSFPPAGFGRNCGAALSGCGPAFERVQPAGRPAAGTIARPTIFADRPFVRKLSSIGRSRRHSPEDFASKLQELPELSQLQICRVSLSNEQG